MTGNPLALLPTIRELRAIRRAVGGPPGDRVRSGQPGSGRTDTDDALVDLLSDPFGTVEEAEDTLRSADELLRARGDRRSAFLTVYAEMTAHVGSGIESGVFEDPDWVRTYLVAFANRYRRALVAYETGDLAAVPEPWAIAFRASTRGATILIQDVLLGVNAHINYDLAYTLRDVSIDPKRRAKRRDHDRINRVLQGLIDVVQRALADTYEREGYRQADQLLGSADESFTLLGLTEARSLAWRNAVLLVDSRLPPVERLVGWRIRAVATGASYFILSPAADRSVLELLRAAERGAPPLEPLLRTVRRRSREATFEVG